MDRVRIPALVLLRFASRRRRLLLGTGFLLRWGSRVRQHLLVARRSSRSPLPQVFFLLGLKRSARMLLQCRLVSRERYVARRRRRFGDDCWSHRGRASGCTARGRDCVRFRRGSGLRCRTGFGGRCRTGFEGPCRTGFGGQCRTGFRNGILWSWSSRRGRLSRQSRTAGWWRIHLRRPHRGRLDSLTREHSGPGWVNRGMRDHLRLRQLLGRHVHYGVCHWLAALKNLGRHRCGGNLAVGIVDVGHIRDVSNVGDVGHVAYVGDVNLAQVIPLIVIPWNEGIAWTKREPRGHCAKPEADADPAHERHQCGRVPGRHRNGSGHPAPPDADQSPSPIVVGTEAPRLSAHPRPAPGFDPSPVTEAIWHPTHSNPGGIPHRAVLRDL